MPAPLVLELLGAPRLRDAAGQERALPSRRALALLAVLAAEGEVARGVTIADNLGGSISMNNGGELDIDGGVFASAGSGLEFHAVRRYTVKVRNASLQSGTFDTLWLEGDAASTFDFGTAAAPGGNTLASTLFSMPLMRIGTAAGVRVDAVGNRWRPTMQGSDFEGHYGPASSVCAGANPCDVPSTTTMLGTNFRFLGAGPGATLRLVGP